MNTLTPELAASSPPAWRAPSDTALITNLVTILKFG